MSRPFQPLPSVERQLINLEEKLRKCQLPCDEKNVRDGRRGGEEGRGEGEEGRGGSGVL